MNQKTSTFRMAAALASSVACFGGAALAQGILSTGGTIVAAAGDAVPDGNGMPLPTVTFNAASGAFDAPSLDDAGNVVFRARFSDSPLTFTVINDRAYFHGSSRATLAMVARGEGQAPGLASGIQLRTATGSSNSLTSTIDQSGDGRAFWASNLFDSTASGLVTSGVDDWAWFGGPVGSQGLIVRRGAPAPGTVGASILQNSFNSATQGINRQGRVHLVAALTGGDTTTTTGMNNQTAIFSGLPGALELVVRKGNPVSGIAGAVAADTSATLSSFAQMNDAGELFYEIALSTTQGTPAATVDTDRAYLVHTPGAGSQLLVRESDVAPGTAGAQFRALTGSAWSIGIGANAWTSTSLTAFTSTLVGGDVSGTANDSAIFVGGVGSLGLRVREGAAAPGTDANFATFNSGSLQVNASGRIAFQSTLTGGTSTTTNDSGIWSDHSGTLQLVVREGQTMPGTGGSTAAGSGFNGALMFFNDQGQVLFAATLAGGTLTGSSWWAHDPVQGLIPVLLPGDQFEIAPGVFRTWNLTTTTAGTSNNSDGRSHVLAHDGRFTLKLTVTDGGSPAVLSDVIVVGRIPPVVQSTPYCFGDGTGGACPCGVSGAGNGCPNSVNPLGANLAGSGVASIANDTFALQGTGMPNGPAAYFQGTAHMNGGLGAVFGDGLRCVDGTFVRLGTRTNSGGASQHPGMGGTPISVAGGVAAGQTRYYQIWYRSAEPFCTVDTWNLSNGLSATWAP